MSGADDADRLEQHVALRMQRLVSDGRPCVVAVSGGSDSMALLELLHRTGAIHGLTLLVGHVDHGISSDRWLIAERVAEAARTLGIGFHLRELQLGPTATETTARRGRRAALRDIARETDAGAIVLAHHADDQAETVLMRATQGSGPAGLAGMSSRQGIWVRPLLAVRRADIAAYLRFRGVRAWTDPANSDTRHLRSWLRSDVMPTLRVRIPEIDDHLNRVGRLARSARQAWNAIPTLIPALDLREDHRGISVAAPVLRGYRSPVRHAIMAALGRRSCVRLGGRRLRALDGLLDHANGAAIIDLDRHVRAELAFGRLAFLRGATPAIESDPVPLVAGEVARLGHATFGVTSTPALHTARADWATDLVVGRYLVRPWRRGDRIHPLGGRGSRAVAVLLREARISAARRSEWPVVVTGDDATIVWVPGICRADAAVPLEGTEAWRVECAFT